MGLQWFLHRHLGVDRRHQLDVGRLRRLGVVRPGLLDVGHLHLLGVDRAGRHVVGVDRPGRHVLDVGRLRRLGVGCAGRRVVGEDRPGHLRRACPAAMRMGCCPGVDRLDVVRLDVGHDRLRGCLRHGVRRTQRRACPAGTRTGCCLGVVHLALELAWRLASVLGLRPAMVHRGLPSRLELLEQLAQLAQLELVLQGLLARPELAWSQASEPRQLAWKQALVLQGLLAWQRLASQLLA